MRRHDSLVAVGSGRTNCADQSSKVKLCEISTVDLTNRKQLPFPKEKAQSKRNTEIAFGIMCQSLLQSVLSLLSVA
jgi:hypothetical protein